MIDFGQVYLAKPAFTESDGTTAPILPQEARLRNLTYAAPLYVDLTKTTMVADPEHPLNQGITNINDMHLEQEGEAEALERVFLGKIPIMVRSNYCTLTTLPSKDLPTLGECQYDQVCSMIVMMC